MARRLTDLYVVGKEVTFDDGHGEAVTVWLQKLHGFDQDQAMSRANAERAKILTLKNRPDDDPEKIVYVSQVENQWDDEQVTRFIAAEDLIREQQSIESKIAHEEEWEKDDYLIGLQAAWDEDSNVVYFDDDADPEAKAEATRVYEELQRFKKQVDEEYAKAEKRILREYAQKSKAERRELAINRLIDSHGDLRWVQEFRKCEVWLATREPTDHDKPYFQSRAEVDRLAPQVLARLMQEYRDLEVTVVEGKD